MTNLTRLRLILVDLSGLMKKKTHLKQNVLFFNDNYVFIVPYSQQYINTSLTNLSKNMFSCGQINIDISVFSLIQQN